VSKPTTASSLLRIVIALSEVEGTAHISPRVVATRRCPSCSSIANWFMMLPAYPHTSAYVSTRQHTSALVSIRQHTSAYVSIRQHTSAYLPSTSASPPNAGSPSFISNLKIADHTPRRGFGGSCCVVHAPFCSISPSLA
jgi:hypothetical protein